MKYVTENDPEILRQRIEKALSWARDGQIDGGHHKAWSIDQMVRALLGCEEVTYEAVLVNGTGYIRS